MQYEFQGVIDTVNPEATYGNNGFKKRTVWLKTEEQYSQTLEIEFTRDNTSLLDGYHPNERVKITANINGRKHDGANGTRVFNTIVGYKIERL